MIRRESLGDVGIRFTDAVSELSEEQYSEQRAPLREAEQRLEFSRWERSEWLPRLLIGANRSRPRVRSVK